MYFCIDGSNNEVVIGSHRLALKLPAVEFSVTVESGTLAIHWYRKVDRNWSFDLPWRPQLVDLEHKVVSVVYAIDKLENVREVVEYEVRELFVPWCLRRARFCHRLFRWQNNCAIGISRNGKTTYRRVTSVDNWLRKNHLERIHEIRQLRVSSESASTS